MGRLAMVHRGRAHVLPPMELLEPYIDRDKHHWYWLGEFHEDWQDRSAEFRWAAPSENPTVFMVPRLLWQLTHPEHTGRLLLENACGLFTCINPEHWRVRRGGFRIPARIVLPGHVEAMPVTSPQAVIVHIQRHDVPHTVCGEGVWLHGTDKKTVITCDDCISAWVRTGQPYTEVT